jgi:hypothetical protein
LPLASQVISLAVVQLPPVLLQTLTVTLSPGIQPLTDTDAWKEPSDLRQAVALLRA